MKATDWIHDLAEREITAQEHESAREILKTHRVAIFIVAYNAERHLEGLVERIPKELLPLFAEIFIIDDSSGDATFDVASRIQKKYSDYKITSYRTPFNRGYGGNQKLGYLYCIEKEHDVVILLHGDGQYAPEYIPRMLAAFAEDCDAVFASRMLEKRRALQGGMPLYKWIGNQILTKFENLLLGENLSEFHTGFRAYRVSSLKKIPFVFNSDDFHFDTEIIIQATANHWKIREVSIPAFYGDEPCHVNGISYAYNCVKAILSYYLVHLGLFYQRNYDFGLFDADNYLFKKSPNSLHQYLLTKGLFNSNMSTIELGANRGILSSYIAPRVMEHTAVDVFRPDLAGISKTMSLNLNTPFSEVLPKRRFDGCVVLDVIEHLDEPENFLSEVFRILKVNGKLYVSTANICYLPVRLSLLFGQFNYGKRGILDRTHKRLFSVSSFKKMITQYGFRIDEVRGFPPPFTDLIGSGFLMRFLEKFHALLSRFFPNLFAYNFLVTATRMDGISEIFEMTMHQSASQQAQQEQKESVVAPRRG